MYFVFLFINIVMMKGILMTVFIRLLHTCILIASHVNLHPTLFLQKLTHIINSSTTCTFQLHTEVNIVIFHFIFICQGIAQQPGTRKIAHLFAFHLPPQLQYMVFENENVSESKIRLCIAYWISRIPLLL